MSNRKPETKTPEDADDPFAAFFEGAERSPGHCLGLAKLEFTEEIVNRMREMDLKRGELARRLGVQPGFVTRLLSGRNNFELGTMVKVALALDCEFRCHLQPAVAAEARSDGKGTGKNTCPAPRATKSMKRSA